MPKARMSTDASWEDEPATEAQLTKLYAMLYYADEFRLRYGETYEDHEDDAVAWVNANSQLNIRRLDDLTKGDMNALYRRLE